MDNLPEEILEIIAYFLSGPELNSFSQVSKIHNRASQRPKHRMQLICKVRNRLMTNVIYLIMRHIYYYNISENKIFDPTFACALEPISSYKQYKEIKNYLFDSYSNVRFINIKCDNCTKYVTFNYFIFDSVDRYNNSFIITLCYRCYCQTLVSYYNIYNKIPNTVGDCQNLVLLLKQNIADNSQIIPLEISDYFTRLEGGYINFQQ